MQQLTPIGGLAELSASNFVESNGSHLIYRNNKKGSIGYRFIPEMIILLGKRRKMRYKALRIVLSMGPVLKNLSRS